MGLALNSQSLFYLCALAHWRQRGIEWSIRVLEQQAHKVECKRRDFDDPCFTDCRRAGHSVCGHGAGCSRSVSFQINIPPRVQKILLGFASGVMLAASVWSLLLPALELSGSWLPVVVGFLVGIGFLLGLDQLTARLHLKPKPGTASANSFC